jgi:hypothetical protein
MTARQEYRHHPRKQAFPASCAREFHLAQGTASSSAVGIWLQESPQCLAQLAPLPNQRMPWFPVIANELAASEARLGCALPRRYKELLSDPRIVRMLSHRAIGALSPNLTMPLFVDITEQFRGTEPGFPSDGVVATLPDGRYVRFWLPDSNQPGILGETIYSWDTQLHRKSRDCTGERWVQSMIEVLYQTEPGFLAEVGYPPPVVKPLAPLLRTRRCDERLLALLALRGDDARAALANVRGPWIPCTHISVSGRYLVPCDLGQLPQPSQWVLKAEPGTYETKVSLAMSARGDRPVITALRVVRDGCDVSKARAVSSIHVDVAAMAVYDRQPFQRRFRIEERDGFVDELVALTERPCVAVAGRTLETLVVPTGEGDGSYPIFELLNGTTIVGLQVEFSD